VFSERIVRQRAARCHDPLVVKVLQSLMEQGHRDDDFLRDGAEPLFVLPAPEAAPGGEAPGAGERATPPRGPGRRHPRAAPGRGRAWLTASLAAMVLALVAAGALAGHRWIHSGVLVLTSDPPGARVSIDGQLLASPTPVTVEGVDLSRSLQVVFSSKDRKSVTVPVEPSLDGLVRRLHADLAGVVGSIVVESSPPGAQVQIDDQPAGVTPLTIPNVRLDQRHRVDVALVGHELDQFVVLPEKDGRRFSRVLSPALRRTASRPGRPLPPP
jgi:hypothetical protein